MGARGTVTLLRLRTYVAYEILSSALRLTHGPLPTPPPRPPLLVGVPMIMRLCVRKPVCSWRAGPYFRCWVRYGIFYFVDRGRLEYGRWDVMGYRCGEASLHCIQTYVIFVDMISRNMYVLWVGVKAFFRLEYVRY